MQAKTNGALQRNWRSVEFDIFIACGSLSLSPSLSLSLSHIVRAHTHTHATHEGSNQIKEKTRTHLECIVFIWFVIGDYEKRNSL